MKTPFDKRCKPCSKKFRLSNGKLKRNVDLREQSVSNKSLHANDSRGECTTFPIGSTNYIHSRY